MVLLDETTRPGVNTTIHVIKYNLYRQLGTGDWGDTADAFGERGAQRCTHRIVFLFARAFTVFVPYNI